MDKKQKGCCKSSKGFTLIELLVVIAIIGILATIVLVSLNSARTKARDTRRLSDMQQMSLAMEMYYDQNGSSYYDGTASFGAYVNALKGAGLIGASPQDPTNSGTNVYTALDGTTSQYCFYAPLEADTGRFSVASQAGAGKRDAAPTSVTTCGPNL
jgi:prepilin-type N-terminal cleavage/methylation domain-containing protein